MQSQAVLRGGGEAANSPSSPSSAARQRQYNGRQY